MIVFVTSDKGGTGRSVTTCNVAYRCALQGDNVCYLDFDFGSPTAGAIFHIDDVARGTRGGGVHRLLRGDVGQADQVDVWKRSDRPELRRRPLGAGRLVLVPGDEGGGEFPIDEDVVRRCVDLFLWAEEEFDLTLVDLSAGRSYASQLALAVTAHPLLRSAVTRWLVFHRWTRQNVIAAAGLAFGEHGIVAAGVACGHDRVAIEDSIRFVRTAVLDPNSPQLVALKPTQAAWAHRCNSDLAALAARHRLGSSMVLAAVPLDPVLQWREQIITEQDIWTTEIANPETGAAFDSLAKRLTDDAAWEGL